MSSYDVRIWGIRSYKGRRGTTYTVRWSVAGRPFPETFSTRALAESFRAKLVTASREGVPFDEQSGLPEPMARELKSRTWYQHAVAFVDMKWPRSSGKHRVSIADSLASVTPALLANDRGAPSDKDVRRALYGWAFNRTRRTAGPPPEDLALVVRWLESNTVKLTALADPALIRKALDALSIRMKDGKPAAATTVARKRAVFSGALRYAVELGHLDAHPFDRVRWIAPKSTEEIDRRVVVNHTQARALLAAVREVGYPELEAFFGCMYYAALRPEEVLHLRVAECELPADDASWGWFHLTGSTVASGNDWSDAAGAIDDRGLKHRARGSTRDVPVPPQLVRLLRSHLERFPPGPGGRVFVTRRGPGGLYFATLPGTPIPNNTYPKAWREARKVALTPAQVTSPLAGRPYDLRHAAVSLWLNAGVPPTQVAEWAGHSVHVLMRVYAKCVYGQEEAARRRIDAALKDDGEAASEGTGGHPEPT